MKLVGIDVTPSEVNNFLFLSQLITVPSFISNNSFIQFEDVSAKLALSASVSGRLNLAGVVELEINDGTVDLVIGLGMDRLTDKIYFSDLKSVVQTLRDKVSWQKIGLIDVSLPIKLKLIDVGSGLSDLLSKFSNLSTIIICIYDDLFSNELPSVKLDIDLL